MSWRLRVFFRPVLPSPRSRSAAPWIRRSPRNGCSAGSRTSSATARDRYCDKEMGEEIGWLVSPFLNGVLLRLHGHGRPRVGGPADRLGRLRHQARREGAGRLHRLAQGRRTTASSITFRRREKLRYTDVEVGDAMFLRPLVLMAGEILKTPALKEKYGAKAEEYLQLAEQTFEKWDSRGAWRETKDGGVWVVPPFGFDRKTGKWTERIRSQEDRRQLPAGQQGEHHRRVDARHVRRDA